MIMYVNIHRTQPRYYEVSLALGVISGDTEKDSEYSHMINFFIEDEENKLICFEPQSDKMDDAVIKKNTQAPHFAFVKGPAWPFVAPYVEELFQTYVDKLGSQVSFVDLSGIFDEALEAHKIIMDMTDLVYKILNMQLNIIFINPIAQNIN